MNDIEKAIETISNYITECEYTYSVDDIIREFIKFKNGSYVSFTAGKVIKACKKELDVIAVEALREKAERSKGCKYCLGEHPLPIVDLDIDNDDVTEDDITFGFVEPLKFCPHCGRNLKEESSE